ncbi:MAG TPA: recombination mediator RecR [Vicinamibacteria bacterium]|nr:recombination mediator RecR [Vicinamibacteria bacterium]
MRDYPEPVSRLIAELKALPGIGVKSAQRIAFHSLRASSDEAQHLARAVLDVKEKIATCSICNNITDGDPCFFCSSPERNGKLLCVVEEPPNVVTIEKTHEFKGRYHVLMGSLSPLQGIGPEELKIKGLLARLQNGEVEEVILATNPNVEGEATAIYVSKLIKPLGVRVTRIAMGIPVGSDLDYADEVTVGKALEGRREY